jgi:hypothetical protein
MRSIIIVDDNPKFLSLEIEEIKEQGLKPLVWMELEHDYENNGSACLAYLKSSLKSFADEPERLAGIILDCRIPVCDLSALDMPHIITASGLHTGPFILYYYLHNKTGESPLGDTFKDTSVLLYTMSPGLDIEYPWINSNVKCRFIEKWSPSGEFSDWIKSL